MRLFFALEPSTAVTVALDAASASLRAVPPDLAWVPFAKRHVTLKFVADADEGILAGLVQAADAVQDSDPLPLRWS